MDLTRISFSLEQYLRTMKTTVAVSSEYAPHWGPEDDIGCLSPIPGQWCGWAAGSGFPPIIPSYGNKRSWEQLCHPLSSIPRPPLRKQWSSWACTLNYINIMNKKFFIQVINMLFSKKKRIRSSWCTCVTLKGLSLKLEGLGKGDWSEAPRTPNPFFFSRRQACWCLLILSICSSTVIRGRVLSAKQSCSTALLGLSWKWKINTSFYKYRITAEKHEGIKEGLECGQLILFSREKWRF